MKVVFLEDVAGVARGGDVKEVKNGYARNYLIPKSLAVQATHNAMQGTKKLSDMAEKTRLKRLKDMKALSEELAGVRVDVEMRAGSGGRLYGSVTNAIIASKLAEITDREIDRRSVTMPDAVRELGLYTASIRLHADVEAEIQLLVYPLGSEPEKYLAKLEGASSDTGDDDAGDEESPEVDGAETADAAAAEEATATDDESVAEVTETATEAAPDAESAEPEMATEEPAADVTDSDDAGGESDDESEVTEAKTESAGADDKDESGS